MKIDLCRGSHSVGQHCYHAVFVIAYRREVFRDKRVLALVKAYLEAKAERMGIVIEAMDFGPDHVHLFVSRCGRWSGYDLQQELKGFTSRMMRKNHRRLFRHLLWGKKFWKRGDFCRSVGSVTADVVKFYIGHCQQEHWTIN